MGTFPLIFAFLALGGTCVNAKFFKFEKCQKNDGLVTVSEFTIKPDPIDLKKNVTITLHMNLKSPLPEKTKLRTTYYKITNLFGVNFDVRVPCLLGKFGSCTKSFCKYLEDFKEQGEPLFPKDVPYGCPMKPGTFGGDNIEIPIPDMGTIARFIVGGKYRTELQLVVEGKVTDCFKFWTEMH
nr:ganglioside GM2 activator-like [Parasteatoda tepidariorum]